MKLTKDQRSAIVDVIIENIKKQQEPIIKTNRQKNIEIIEKFLKKYPILKALAINTLKDVYLKDLMLPEYHINRYNFREKIENLIILETISNTDSIDLLIDKIVKIAMKSL